MSSLEENANSNLQKISGTQGTAEDQNNDYNGNNSTANSIRTYLVLLHDCLAIKFVPERESHHKTNNNLFPNRPQSSLGGCCNCPSLPSNGGTLRGGSNRRDGIDGGYCNATVSTAHNSCDNNGSSTKTNCLSCNCSNINVNEGHDGKSNSHYNRHSRQHKSTSHEEANEDHQECQFYRHQANQSSYPQDIATQSHQAPFTLKANNDNNEGEIRSPTGNQPNHHVHSSMMLNSNKSDHSSNGKREYDMAAHGSQYCGHSINSHNDTHWESGQSKHHLHNAHANNSAYLKKPHQQTCPTLSFNSAHQAGNDQQSQHHPSKSSSTLKDEAEATYSMNNGTYRSSKPSFLEGNNGRSLSNRMDHSVQALFLYKEFQDINLKCFWNSAVHEAFKNLEYKGSIVPSTILVGSSIRKHLIVLKTAWSRKMLRSPAGYTIEFLGEIEELIADPIAKSHFVPLSDSLCWTIHELTSSGQEAFVDDIFLSLASAFPGMALPTKELIYQTLEKLTRERKIYQTAQGYFVVTPDTHRYIMSTEPLLMQASSVDYQLNSAAANLIRNTILFQQASALRPESPAPQTRQEQPQQQERTNQEMIEQANLDCARDALTSPSPDPDTYSLPYGTFRRYNSLRIRKDVSATTTGCLPRRTLSMRLPKSKKKNGNISSHSGSGGGGDQALRRADVTDSFQNLNASQASTVNEQLLSRRRKHKSFLSRLLSFRSVRKISGRKDKTGRNATSSTKGQSIIQNDKSSSGQPNVGNSKVDVACSNDANKKEGMTSPSAGRPVATHKLTTSSTQTSFSLENINTDLALLTLSNASKHSTLEREDSDSGRCTDSHSDADAEITAALNRGLTPIMRDHRRHIHLLAHDPDSRRLAVGRSHSSCNVYEKIESDLGLKVDVEECDGRSPRSPSSQMSVSPSPSTFTTASAMYPRGSSISNRHNLYSRCHSSASSSNYSYRDFYNLYRRRYPSYQPSSPTSLESAEVNEGLRFRPQQPLRYPPRAFERKQIFDEINRGSFREKKSGRSSNKSVSIVCNNGNDANIRTPFRAGQQASAENLNNEKDSSVGSERNDESVKMNAKSTHSTTNTITGNDPLTTILSHTLKNTTNLNLEFCLPLGSIFNAALTGTGGNTTATAKAPDANAQSSSESSSRSNEGCSQKPETGERVQTLNEVNTMVNDLFTIKSFVKTNPLSDELSSTIEFKTRGNNAGAGNGCSYTINGNNNSKTTYMIEAVSSKPLANIHTKFNRESEII